MLEQKLGVFWRIQEILYLIGTKILEFGQRGADKIRFKDFTLASKYPCTKIRALVFDGP